LFVLVPAGIMTAAIWGLVDASVVEEVVDVVTVVAGSGTVAAKKSPTPCPVVSPALASCAQ